MLGCLVVLVVFMLVAGNNTRLWVPWTASLRLRDLPGLVFIVLAGPAARRRLWTVMCARSDSARARMDVPRPPRPPRAPGPVTAGLLAHPPAFHPSGEVLVDRSFADIAEIIRLEAAAPCWCGKHGEEARRWASELPPG